MNGMGDETINIIHLSTQTAQSRRVLIPAFAITW